ncbi:hypothetical protein [Rhizobium sp. MHM7A]|uniref:hypothetical protein n=1 Tax=Rhizobium sp. MHM7A TaxID=2583233 RepID=UPI001106C7B3|nr:hypothetical protein [Rhizobium sp. MHM7A]TLX15990.1 hypothetical protein FFR93_01345 [Rhizobium sp. MHM7A]
MKAELRSLIDEQEQSIKDENPDAYDLGDEPDEEDNLADDGETISVFPNGDHAAFCTSWADDLRERLGSEAVALFGFSADENPDSHVSKIADGHDFAILHKRYIVDGWTTNVESIHPTGVMDIEDDDDLEEIIRLYGDPRLWEPRANELADPDNQIAAAFAERLETFKSAPRLS